MISKADRAPAPTSKAAWSPLQIAIGIILFLLVLGVFYPVTGNDFINYDDNDYVTANLHVQRGLVARQIAWAFANTDAANWHPLTWLSHMLDCQLYGANPWGHHLTSVLLHTLSVVILFFVLRNMTGFVWRSLFAALLFGLHPQRVESVAWIAERKDVLATMFWLLTLWAYLGWVKNRATRPRLATVNYWIAVLWFVLGLMSKPMVVTLPFTLLLLDYWPLGRTDKVSLPRLIWEKAPFFVLAAAGSIVAFFAQRSQGAVIEFLPLSHRLETAVIAYSRYIGKFFYPVNLAILYPHPISWSPLQVAGAILVFLVISAIVIMSRRMRPYSLMGWLWYVGTLTPVIGVIQIGSQSMADRYTYVPDIGLILILTWGICDATAKLPWRRLILGTAATAAILCCMVLTRRQIAFWKDSGTVFRHAIAVTDNAFVARKILADFYVTRGRNDEALNLYRESLQMYPGFEGAHMNLGALYNQAGHPNEAIAEFKESIRLNPNDASAYNDLGAVLGKEHLDDAIALFKKAIEINPSYADARKNMGRAMDAKGRINDAVAQYQIAIQLQPDSEAFSLLGLDLEKTGRDKEAIFLLTESLKAQPNNPAASEALERLKKRATN